MYHELDYTTKTKDWSSKEIENRIHMLEVSLKTDNSPAEYLADDYDELGTLVALRDECTELAYEHGLPEWDSDLGLVVSRESEYLSYWGGVELEAHYPRYHFDDWSEAAIEAEVKKNLHKALTVYMGDTELYLTRGA